jgi:transcriptional regulator with XRE-family HTH domain
MKAETKTNNRLWQARHKSGLEQKQVARILGHKSCDQISRYERGARIPGLRIALKLELIYATPVSTLFPEHYGQYRGEIAANTSINSVLPLPDEKAVERLPEAHVCTYGSVLLQKKLTESDIDTARQHTIKLMRRIGEVIGERSQTE